MAVRAPGCRIGLVRENVTVPVPVHGLVPHRAQRAIGGASPAGVDSEVTVDRDGLGSHSFRRWWRYFTDARAGKPGSCVTAA